MTPPVSVSELLRIGARILQRNRTSLAWDKEFMTWPLSQVYIKKKSVSMLIFEIYYFSWVRSLINSLISPAIFDLLLEKKIWVCMCVFVPSFSVLSAMLWSWAVIPLPTELPRKPMTLSFDHPASPSWGLLLQVCTATLVYTVHRIQPRASCVLGKRFPNWAPSPAQSRSPVSLILPI